MRKLRRCVERNQRGKKVLGKAAMAVLAASLAMTTLPVYSYADVNYTIENLINAHGETISNVKVIDISKATISNGKISILIEEDGAYMLKGSNLIGGAYVDTQITVGTHATVDLYLDGLEIFNDDYNVSKEEGDEITSYFSDSSFVSPFVIYGTANIYVQSDSTIRAITDYFTILGVANFIESKNNAQLTCGLSKKLNYFSLPVCMTGSGNANFKGAKVKLLNETQTGEKYSEMSSDSPYDSLRYNLYSDDLTAENVKFSEVYASSLKLTVIDEYIEVTGIDKSIIGVYDLDGNPKNFIETMNFASGMENADVVQINDVAVSEIKLSAEATLSNVWVSYPLDNPNESFDYFTYFYVKNTDGTTKCVSFHQYKHDGKEPFETFDAYDVKFVDSDSNTVMQYYGKEGDVIKFPAEESQYIYTYNFNSESLTKGVSQITGDMTIEVSKALKPTVSVTLDGETKSIDPGMAIEDILAVFDSDEQGDPNPDTDLMLCYNETMGCYVLPKEKIIDPCTLVMTSLRYEIKDNDEVWYDIASKEALIDFAEFVNAGNVSANAVLSTDVSFYDSDNFPGIGQLTVESKGNGDIKISSKTNYTGIFDGGGHVVDLKMLGFSNGGGLFGCVGAGAVIKNVTVSGVVSGDCYMGGLIGGIVAEDDSSEIRISNCINKASVSGKEYVGGLVGGSDNFNDEFFGPEMKIIFDCCANTGEVGLTDLSEWNRTPGGIIGVSDASGSVSFSNCYNTADVLLSARGSYSTNNCYSTVVSDSDRQNLVTYASMDDFKSGKVTYLLNKYLNENIWYQRLDGDEEYLELPKFNGNEDTETVYGGYLSCDDTEMSYSNTAFEHTKKGHELPTGGTPLFEFENGKIIGSCKWCGEEITASVAWNAEQEYGGEIKGVTVTKSDEWTFSDYPDITIKYSAEQDGDYSEELPTSVGEWFIRAYVGETSTVDLGSFKIVHTRHVVPDSMVYENGTINAGCSLCNELFEAYITCNDEERSDNPTGVSVELSDEWKAAGYPQIIIKYSSSKNGDYSESKPTSVGTWYLKACVGDDCEVEISDTYKVIPNSEEELKKQEEQRKQEEQQKLEEQQKAANTAKDELISKVSAKGDALFDELISDAKLKEEIVEKENDYVAANGIVVSQPQVSANANSLGVDASKVTVLGTGLNASKGDRVALSVDIPTNPETVDEEYKNVVQLEIKLLLNDKEATGKLAMPIVVTMPVPTGVDLNELTIIHVHSDGTWEEIPFVDNGDGTLTICVRSFSTFIFASGKIDSIEDFVSRMYESILGRKADETGKSFWEELLRSHRSDGVNMAFGFINSDEFVNKGLSDEEYIDTLYNSLLGREADADGKAYWMSLLTGGESRSTVLAGVINSAEFRNLCEEAEINMGIVLDDSTIVDPGVYGFVNRMYVECLSRQGEYEGVRFWSAMIAQGKLTPFEVVSGFVNSEEFVMKQVSDEEYLNKLYSIMFDRLPDELGFEFWLKLMDEGMTRDEVLLNFSNSDEFMSVLEEFGL